MISAICNVTRSLRPALALAALAFASLAGSAQADTITYMDSVALQTTNFTSSVSIPLFDASLGTLTGITFTLDGSVQGTAKFESLDAAPATVTTNLGATITLTRPDASTIAVALPVVSASTNVTAFDNVIDFGGTSGRTFADQMASDSDSLMSPPPASDLTLFTGIGNITLGVGANGNSSATGAGNLITQFATQASANVDGHVHLYPSRARAGQRGAVGNRWGGPGAGVMEASPPQRLNHVSTTPAGSHSRPGASSFRAEIEW